MSKKNHNHNLIIPIGSVKAIVTSKLKVKEAGKSWRKGEIKEIRHEFSKRTGNPVIKAYYKGLQVILEKDNPNDNYYRLEHLHCKRCDNKWYRYYGDTVDDYFIIEKNNNGSYSVRCRKCGRKYHNIDVLSQAKYKS